MNRMFTVGLVTPGVAQSVCAVSSGGAVSDGKYFNKQLGLSYRIPKGLSASDPKSLPQDPKGHGAILLALWKTPPEYDKPSVFIMTDDPSQYVDKSALGYMRRIENTVGTLQHGKILQSGRRYELSGSNFYRLDYQFPQESPAIYNTALTGLVGNCELTFQVTAKTEAEIEKLFQSLMTATISPK
jgi:hypothetical protein